jgi:hypothetical protein
LRAPRLVAFAAVLVASLCPRASRALPVAYVSTAPGPLVAHTGVVVMMREGTHTILSMQTNYDGPLETFAVIVPLPAELKPSDVRTLPRALFERVVAAGAPRLVELWEDDPCGGRGDGGPSSTPRRGPHAADDAGTRRRVSHAPGTRGAEARAPHGGELRTAEAAPSEYDVHVLTEAESANVVGWLRVQSYVVSAELEATLSAYAGSGAHFVVARFDPTKTEGGSSATAPRRAQHAAQKLALLPPLRFTFDSDRFELPLGLGRASSAGTQDLVLYVLARHQRYAATDWDDLLAPTGLELTDAAAPEFTSVYRSIFDKLVSGNPRAAVTEYVHDALTCEPCAAPPLDATDLLTLGADALPAAPGERESPSFGSGFVLTRMQLRYGKDDAVPDLSLRAVPPLAAPAAGAGAHDDFQALYTVHHAWDGPTPCDAPSRGKWGSRGTKPRVAARLAFGSKDEIDLASMIKDDVPALDVVHAAPPPPDPPAATSTPPPAPRATGTSGCGCAEAGGGPAPLPLALAACVAALARRRSR